MLTEVKGSKKTGRAAANDDYIKAFGFSAR